MKKIKHGLLFILSSALLLGQGLFGCSESSHKKFTVLFEGNGGTLVSGETTQTVRDASELSEPTFELRGYSFDGWDIPLNTISESTTVKAEWRLTSYTITYNLDGGTNSALNPSHYNIKNDSVYLYPASKNGYLFDYWSTEEGLRITRINSGVAKDYTLYAHYKTINYAIKYELNGGTFVGSAPETYNIETETIIPDAYREGYTFLGWSKNQNGNNASKDYAIESGNYGDITLFAIYSGNEYEVEFDVNGGNSLPNSIETYTFGSSYFLPTPSRIGYDFINWTYNNQVIEQNGIWSISNNVTLVANWIIHNYEISYILNGGVNNQTNVTSYNYENADITITEPTRPGYSFIGWNDGSSTQKPYIISHNSSGNLALEAIWEANKYNVSLDVNGGNQLSKDSYELIFDEMYELPIPTRPGYTFSGWYYEQTKITSEVWNIPNDVTLLASWDRDEYQITYILNGGENHPLNPSSYNYDDTDIDILSASKNGYTFTGWSTEQGGELITSPHIDHNSIGDRTYYANWSANTYVITYDLNGGSGIDELTEEVVFDTNHISPTPYREGYSFVGWLYYDSIISDGIWKIYDNCTLKALWVANQYTVTKTYGGSSSEQTVTYDSNYNLGTLSKENYNFNGWYTEEYGNGTKYTNASGDSLNIYKDSSSITLFAAFTYTVSFETNGGTPLSDIEYKENECLSPAIVASKENRTFGGWYLDEELTNPVSYSEPLGNCQLYAKWVEEIEPTKLTYANNSGNITVSKTSYDGESFILPSHIGGKPITTISQKAFTDKSFIDVVVPNTVTSIGNGAFRGCNSIVNITLPFVGGSKNATFNSIPFGYIFGCDSSNYGDKHKTSEGLGYTTQDFSSSGQYHYFVPSSIRNVTITSITALPLNAFYNCDLLENISIPSSINSIGNSAFRNCSKLTRFNSETDGYFNIPNLVTSIGEYTFCNCSLATKFTMSDNIQTIGQYAFKGCSSTNYFNSTIPYCLNVPSSCKTIGDNAFREMNLITDVVVPNTVTSIGNGAFRGCNSIVNITLPFVGGSKNATFNSIPFGYIFGCDSSNYGDKHKTSEGLGYTTQDFSSSGQYHYFVPSSIRNVTITSITALPTNAFYNCDLLETVTIPTDCDISASNCLKNCNATIIRL